MQNSPQFDRNRHGGLFDRGNADSWYGRPRNPHGIYNGKPVTELTAEDVAEYNAGYEENEENGGKKDWG